MARPKGSPAYPGKSKAGTFYLTLRAYRMMKAAAKRWKKGEADVLEHCLLTTAPTIDRGTQPVTAPIKDPA